MVTDFGTRIQASLGEDDFVTDNLLFSPGQLAEIENISLGDIFCSTGDDIKETTNSVFHLNADTLKCENSRKIDLRKWAESCTTSL